jgi:hypothetical protein
MEMTDKDWLERVTIAYKVYSEQVGPTLDIENFVSWMYRQYGIIEPGKKTD